MWRKSSYCNGASSCVELRWVTASSCNNGNCVAVTCTNGEVWVRDSKLGDASPILRFTVGSWWSYLAAVKSRQLGTWGGPVLLVRSGPGGWRMWDERDYQTALEFTDGEVSAFLAGVDRGEFDPPALASGVHGPGGDGPGGPPGSTLATSGGDSVPV